MVKKINLIQHLKISVQFRRVQKKNDRILGTTFKFCHELSTNKLKNSLV
jgi:hypothetical protein